MKAYQLVATAVIMTLGLASPSVFAQTTPPGTSGSGAGTSGSGGGNITQKASTPQAASQPVTDPRQAAENFVRSVNLARVSIAMKNYDQARQHIARAREMLSVMRNASSDQRRVTGITSGRVTYQGDTTDQHRYFPVETGPVEVRQLGKGPLWADKGLAVTDADIVTLTVDLGSDDADKRLAAAETALNNGKYNDADDELENLISDVVSIDEKAAMPIDKARDNIALARNFVAAGNYDGARFALDHADDALSDVEDDPAYNGRRQEIGAMRTNIRTLQDTINKRDPTLMRRAGDQLNQWWNDIKSWGDSGPESQGR